jgi:hypothetical protein
LTTCMAAAGFDMTATTAPTLSLSNQ